MLARPRYAPSRWRIVVGRAAGNIDVDPAIIERGHINPDDVVEGVLPDRRLARQGRSKGTAVPACAPLHPSARTHQNPWRPFHRTG
jgi:hypothetical protein